jgi:hypothetical protein
MFTKEDVLAYGYEQFNMGFVAGVVLGLVVFLIFSL